MIVNNLFIFRHLETKTTALNLGSYNYLGFAQNKGRCADAAEESVRKLGVGVCSTRHELGKICHNLSCIYPCEKMHFVNDSLAQLVVKSLFQETWLSTKNWRS